MKFKNVLFLSLSLCVLASSAFAKAGYDNFGIVVDDPTKIYTGDVQFKYNCVMDHGQTQHALVAQRYGDRLIGVAKHNLICPDYIYGHELYSITIGLTKLAGGFSSHTYTVNLEQHANSTLDCHVDAFGSATCTVVR